jgi:choline dehydrogenase-like flavoprotein
VTVTTASLRVRDPLLDGDDRVELQADVCVIGTGAGGAVAAAELAEAGLDVVALEEGAHHRLADFGGPPLQMMRRLYRDDGLTATVGAPSIVVPVGRCIGGTTVINAGTCFRTPDAVLHAWRAEAGAAALGPDAMRPYFDAVESFLGVAPVPDDLLGPNGATVARGVRALGWSGGPIRRNAPGCRGRGLCIFGCPENAKQSMNISYVPRAAAAGARFVARCRAERVRLDHGEVREVLGRIVDPHGRARGWVRVACRAAAVACGTLFTPLLLRRSDVADRSGQVGRNLRLHPATRIVGLFPERIESWRGVLQGFYVDQFHDDGIMLETVSVHPGVLAAALPGFGRAAQEVMTRFAHMAVLGVMVHDDSRGQVRGAPGGLLLATYRLGRDDISRLQRGVAAGARIMFAAGAQEVLTGIFGHETLRGEPDVRALEESTRVRARDLELMSLHPMGTARLGADPDAAVVDEDLAVHGAEGLCVMDASVFPTSLGVNPQISIMALTTRAARRLAERLGGRPRPFASAPAPRTFVDPADPRSAPR